MKKLNNQGISLVELLVAFAVGAILLSALALLVSQATRGFRTQVSTAQVQNDANITLNQLENQVMEATRINLQNETNPDGTELAGGSTHFLQLSDGIIYIYDSGTGILYLADDKYTSQTDLDTKASIVCEGVKAFSVKLVKSGFELEDDGTGRMVIRDIRSSVQLQLALTVENNQRQREITRTVNTRNSLKLSEMTVGEHPLSTQLVSFDDIAGYVTD